MRPCTTGQEDKKYSLARIFAAVWRSSDAMAGSWRAASVKETISLQRRAWNGSIAPICGQERQLRRESNERGRDVTEKEKTWEHKGD